MEIYIERTFHGMPILTNRGVRLLLQKAPAADRPIENLTDISKIYVPLSLFGDEQAGGCVLHRYAAVMSGQAVAKPKTATGAPVFSPVSGVYTDRQTIEHPLYGALDCLVLDCMDTTRPAVGAPVDTAALSAAQIVDIARQHAVIDELDGRFVYEKLRDWADGCDVLVGDGVENEPYASAAWEVLGESVEQVYAGLELAARAVGAPTAHLAVQRLPANHRRALAQRLGDDNRLFTVRGKYPAATYTKKPFGKRVRRIGVQALLALYRAAAFHEVHLTCVVTVTGAAVSTPKNVRVPFGTPATALFRACGLAADPTTLVFGDMMTGQATEDADMPILPGVTCLLALTDPPHPAPDVCVGCGRCAQVCHRGLMPCAVVRAQDAGHPERVAKFHPEDCDNCGACSCVCPAGIELSARMFAAGQAINKTTEGDGSHE